MTGSDWTQHDTDGIVLRSFGKEPAMLAIIAAAILAQAAPVPRTAPAPRATPARPAPVAPPSPTNEASDGRCLLAFAAIGSNGTPEQQNAARLGALYFYGKLVGRNPRLDLVPLMRTSAAAVQASAQAEITRCGGELQAAGTAMQAAGQAFEAK
jgi:hypothetical protein